MMEDIMEEEKTRVESLFEHFKEYISTSMEIIRLKAVHKGAKVAGSAVSVMLGSLVIFVSVILLSIGLSLYLGGLLNSTELGFTAVGGFYLLVGIIMLMSRNDMGKPFSNRLVKQIFNDKDDE